MGRKALYPPSVRPGIPRLGRIPQGWRKVAFGDVLEVVARPAKVCDDRQYQLVNAKRNRGGIAPRAVLFGRDIKTKTQFFVAAGEFVISRRQIIHGACGIVPPTLDGALVSNEYTSFVAKDGLCLKYLEWYSHTTHFQQTCFHSSIGVDVEKMVFRQNEWLRHKFALPPMNEQEKIRMVLDKWQFSCDETVKLIETKRQLKKSLMHQLFTGRQRFLGFGKPTHGNSLPAGWSRLALGDVVAVVFSNVDKKSHKNEIPVRLCNYLDVYNNDYITQDLAFMQATATANEIDRFELKCGDVIITKDSETPEDIAKTATVVEDLRGVICGYHLAILRPKKGCHGPFLGQMLMLPRVRNDFTRIANGATRYGLNLSTIIKIPLLIPGEQEQRKIAAAFRALEKEIALLVLRVGRLEEQKSGLMRKLLAGEIRVRG